MNKRILSEKIRYFTTIQPEKIALFPTSGPPVSYLDFMNIYDSTKEYISEIDIKPYERVAILSQSPMPYVLLGLPLMENAVLAPIDSEFPLQKLREHCELFHVDYLFSDRIDPSLLSLAKVLNIGIILFTPSNSDGRPGYRFHMELDRIPSERPAFKKSDTAIIGTTSGTTSKPKIVPVTYQSLVASHSNTLQLYDLDHDSLSFIISKSFKNIYLYNVIGSLIYGGAALVSQNLTPAEIVRLLNDYPVTGFTATPAVLSVLSSYISDHHILLESKSLNFVDAIGAPLAPEIRNSLESTFKTAVIQTYGMTEVQGIASTYKSPKGYKNGSVGVSIGPGVKIVDGEILISGPTVFTGYENVEESKDSYLSEGWFHTGDMGYIDDDGYIFITGRIKEMINRGGEKISPYEIEEALFQHPQIKDAVVFPYPSSLGIEDVGCALVLKEGTMDLQIIRTFLADYLSPYKMPTLLYVVDELPVGDNCKIQRKSLYDTLHSAYPEKEKGIVHSNKTSGKTSSHLEDTTAYLIQCWSELLNLDSIGLDDDFFSLGGDSLFVARLLSAIEKDRNLQIPVSSFFETPTIRSLALYMERLLERPQPNLDFLVPLKETGDKAPLICVHTGDGSAVTYHGLGTHIEEGRPVYALRFNEQKEWKYPLSFEQMAEAYVEDILLLTDGPYHLLGTCYGGVLALEIANILNKRGRNVATIFMLDSATPTKGKKDHTRLWRNAFHQMKELNGKKILALGIKKANTLRQVLITRFMEKVYTHGIKFDIHGLVRFAGARAALYNAYSRYKPSHYQGSAYYFEAVKDNKNNSGWVAFWQTLVEDLQTVAMPCHHSEINHDENSYYIARQIEQLMDEHI